MSRYNNSGSSNDYDSTTIKLSQYAAVRFAATDATSYTHQMYGTSFIINYEDFEVLDGVILQREDKPDTFKIFSADEFFNLNPEDGLIYENFSEDDGYSDPMSAEDILNAPRVSGYSTNAGGDKYFYEPVAAVVESAADVEGLSAVAVAADKQDEVEVTDEPAIFIGDASMLLSNSSWVRTFAKKMTQMGDAVVNDNGEDPTPRGKEENNPKYTSHDWLATEEPDLREEVVGRSLELWITEETQEWEDGESSTFSVPNVMDVKTDNMVTIDNGVEGGDSGSDSSSSGTTEASADGGTVTQSSGGSSTTTTETTETTEKADSPDTTETTETTTTSGRPDGVPETLDHLIDYLNRNNDSVTAEKIKQFAEDEVDNPDEIDWEAAAEYANSQ
jgi:hypothetical protein